MKKIWPFLERAAVIITLITASVSVVWFAFDLASRVGRLEAQMQAITTAPVSGKTALESAPAQSAIQQACAELARKASEESKVARSYTIDLIEKLNCGHQNSN
jgi:hypothetical protein